MSNFDTEVSIQSDVINQSQVNEQLRCSICHEDFRLSEPVSKLVCNHVFHQCCITPWLERRDTCPVCRRVLRESPDPETDSDDDLFADDEDEGALDVEQEVVVFDNAVSDGLVTVSVQYRSLVDQQNQTLLQTTNIAPRSSDVSLTMSDSDSCSDIFPDFLDSPSSSTENTNAEACTFENSSGNTGTLSECDDSTFCFLELDDDTYDSDTSDVMNLDFTNNFESDDLNFTSSSNYFDFTFESNMDIDHDFL